MPRKHVTFINNGDISASYAIILSDSQKPEIPKPLRGFAGVILSDHRIPASKTTFYAASAEKAFDMAIDHLANLTGNKGHRCIIEDGIDLP